MNGSHRVVGTPEWFGTKFWDCFGTTARAVLMLNRNGAEIFFYVISCGAKDFVRNNASIFAARALYACAATLRGTTSFEKLSLYRRSAGLLALPGDLLTP